MKKQLLDPLGSLCRCISLIFHDKNTKISIRDHILTLEEPSSIQWIIRTCKADSKENISELYHIIIRIIEWYIVPHNNLKNKKIDIESSFIKESNSEITNSYKEINESDSDDEEDSEDSENVISINSENKSKDRYSDNIVISNHNEFSTSSNADDIINSDIIIDLVKYLCRAFEKVQETYEDGNVIFAAQYFIILLKDALDDKYNKDRLPKIFIQKDKSDQTLLDYDKIKNIWDLEKLSRVKALYDQCIDLYDNDQDGKSLETRKKLIKSYLDAIYSILNDNDKEFQRLIDNSKRG